MEGVRSETRTEVPLTVAAPHHTTVATRDRHVTYRVFEERKARLRDLLAGRARSRPFREVHAVRGVSLTAGSDEMIGGFALGMTRNEVEERFDEMVPFAGLGEFIDLPMKAYSTGMRARLHFAISTAVTPEILLIDEASAVGDNESKERSLDRVRELQQQAGTVILVTHNLNEVCDHCTRAIWMEHGVAKADGDPLEVVEACDERVKHR